MSAMIVNWKAAPECADYYSTELESWLEDIGDGQFMYCPASRIHASNEWHLIEAGDIDAGWLIPRHYDDEITISAKGIKHDSDKPRMDLIPPHAEMLLAKVLTFGATKYAPENWRLVADLRSRYIAAAMRHINAWRIGEEDDPETGLPHLAHAMCNLAFIVEVEYLEGYTRVADAEESPNDPNH